MLRDAAEVGGVLYNQRVERSNGRCARNRLLYSMIISFAGLQRACDVATEESASLLMGSGHHRIAASCGVEHHVSGAGNSLGQPCLKLHGLGMHIADAFDFFGHHVGLATSTFGGMSFIRCNLYEVPQSTAGYVALTRLAIISPTVSARFSASAGGNPIISQCDGSGSGKSSSAGCGLLITYTSGS